MVDGLIWSSITHHPRQSLYPGTNVSRDAAALELLALLLSSASLINTHPAYRRALAPLLAAPSAVFSLLNLFLAPWERTRRQAFDLLVSFPPGPLPGLMRAADGRYAAGNVWSWDLSPLCLSSHSLP